jgi:hypothetical protein
MALSLDGTTGISASGNITGNNISVSGSLTVGSFSPAALSVSGNITGGNLITGGFVSATGNITGGNLNTSGSMSASGNITGLNINSSNADLAEMYRADQHYEPGTVVEFGGMYEITISKESHTPRVAGVVSTAPSYLMNSSLNSDHALQIALVGRVPCRVVGTIAKGDRLVASEIPGVATALESAQYQPGCVIGKSLESYNSSTPGVIEVVVGRV